MRPQAVASVDEEMGDYAPPPATLAAQLVNNLTNGRKPSFREEQDDFKLIVAEVSNFDKIKDDNTTLEEITEYNHKLVYVVSKATLEVLINDDPFANHERLIEQAAQGLEVLIASIQETPSILEAIAAPDSRLRTGRDIPLWLWLFPRLLTLVGRERCEALQDRLHDFFKSAFTVSKSPRLSNLASHFFYYLRHCADGALHYLSTPNAKDQSTKTSLKLPTANFEEEVYILNNPDMDSGVCTYTLNDGTGAFRHVSGILVLLIRVLSSDIFSNESVPALQSHILWLFDSLRDLRTMGIDFKHSILGDHEWTSSCLTSLGFLLRSRSPFLTLDLKRKGYRLLSVFCADIFQQRTEMVSDTDKQATLAGILLDLASFCRSDQLFSQALAKLLYPALAAFSQEQEQDSLADEIGAKSDLLKCIDVVSDIAGKAPNSLFSPRFLSEAYICEDDNLTKQLGRLGIMVRPKELGDSDDLENLRPRKRRKFEARSDYANEVFDKFYSFVPHIDLNNGPDVGHTAAHSFARLNDADRCEMMRLLALIPCASQHSAKYSTEKDGSVYDLRCDFCNISTLVRPFDKIVFRPLLEAKTILLSLLSLPEFEQSRKPRILAMLALRNLAMHHQEPDLIDLEESPLGQWCLGSLRSSVRELRVAAGRTLPVFLKEGLHPDITRKNKINVLNILREFSDKSPTHLAETWVLAWGQIGRASQDQELNLALLRLVEYLGDTNQIVSGAAFNEILSIADAQGIPVGQLFSPFWRSIAYIGVKDLQSRPQTTQLVADLLSMTVPDLLVATQAHSLPWLVLNGKVDVIARIANARGDNNKSDACLDNMASIMALLLRQNTADADEHIMGLLRKVSSQFKDTDLTECLRIEPIKVAVELLKVGGEEDESKKTRVRYALQTLASHSNISGYVHNKKASQVGLFLEQFSLGIMSHFSDLLNDTRSWQSFVEKRRSLRGIDEMLRVGRSHVKSALPQIIACLQSALGVAQLRTIAFEAWTTLIKCLDQETVESMLQSTFSTIISNWDAFDKASKERAEELFDYLVATHPDMLRRNIDLLPRLNNLAGFGQQAQKLESLRVEVSIPHKFQKFCERLAHQHSSVLEQALSELSDYLQKQQGYLQASATSEQPDKVVGELLRSILDACVRFGNNNPRIARLSAECIGKIGCVDSNRVEAVREHKSIVVLSNFGDAGDTTDFVLFLLEEVLVKAFLSATNPKAQGFFSYVMQELLERCDFRQVCAMYRKNDDQSDAAKALYGKWRNLPESVQMTLSPFLTSKYTVTAMSRNEVSYPIFQPDKSFNVWLRAFVLDLLEKPYNTNAILIFGPLCRVIKIQDTSVANFLLPFVVLHSIVLGPDEERENISNELQRILSHAAQSGSHQEVNNLNLCSEAVFRILDYCSRWLQEMQAKLRQIKGNDSRSDDPDSLDNSQKLGIQRVNSFLAGIPAELISRRAVECKSYARALFHWEQHIRDGGYQPLNSAPTALMEHLQEIYIQIDEPDGIEGIAAYLPVLDIDQQILSHRKAGRWTAAQSWYEIKLAQDPNDVDAQINLLHCMKESGQHDNLLNFVEGIYQNSPVKSKLLPFAAEAAWSTNRWDALEKYLSPLPVEVGGDFNVNLGRLLLFVKNQDMGHLTENANQLKEHIARSLSEDTTSTLGGCRDAMLKFQILDEIQMIGSQDKAFTHPRPKLMENLDRRLEVIGAYQNDKQYVLGIRRAAMQLTGAFEKHEIASAWLTSARLARKGNSLQASYNAVLHASKLGDDSSMIEHARLLWKEGQHRKAIQSLRGAIETNAFISHHKKIDRNNSHLTEEEFAEKQNILTARAHLLLAKWLDSAGQTHSMALRSQYQLAAKMHNNWEKGHYYLGRHYDKLLEFEKALPFEQQAQIYLVGETAKLVIENYLRALTYGTKYIYQTLPRIITLWLDLGTQVMQPVDSKYGTKDHNKEVAQIRKDLLASLHHRFDKYISKMPAYIFYTALPQIVSRISHSNTDVYQYLQQIIVKVITAHPQQALWTLLAVSTSTQSDRKARGQAITRALLSNPKKAGTGSVDLKSMISKGEKLSQQLLLICTAGDFGQNRTTKASISRDLGFVHHRASMPSPLAVPVETTLMATLPTLTDNVRSHKAFSRDVVTIFEFLDQVLVLSSLQKPRKITARGSDGKLYGLLCKPKDDLRKDQRLMEFNSMINRSLKRDSESSKRHLYIKTYAVTPLNEECGIIEWVDGLKTLRDILLALYKTIGVQPNYAEIRIHLDEACKSDEKLPIFREKVISQFPPVFHKWFVQQFPEPSAWFTARLKYTRSCAVMSMVGTILGLGDRHGENILFEEGNGGTFHVDFNCLFDKGLTFSQPERVPFRLTHNMVDAMGVYGYEGPFRKSSELTLKLLRQHEETLMTILESFIYDPTLDLLTNKKKKPSRETVAGRIPDTPQGVLEVIRRKLRGLLQGESVPLGVEGQVDELIKQAVSEKNLAAMYIGWSQFL